MATALGAGAGILGMKAFVPLLVSAETAKAIFVALPGILAAGVGVLTVAHAGKWVYWRSEHRRLLDAAMILELDERQASSGAGGPGATGGSKPKAGGPSPDLVNWARAQLNVSEDPPAAADQQAP